MARLLKSVATARQLRFGFCATTYNILVLPLALGWMRHFRWEILVQFQLPVSGSSIASSLPCFLLLSVLCICRRNSPFPRPSPPLPYASNVCSNFPLCVVVVCPLSELPKAVSGRVRVLSSPLLLLRHLREREREREREMLSSSPFFPSAVRMTFYSGNFPLISLLFCSPPLLLFELCIVFLFE